MPSLHFLDLCFQNCTNPLSLNISPGLLCSYKRMLIDLLIWKKLYGKRVWSIHSVWLFQKCGHIELKFLTDSGLFFGFLLGPFNDVDVLDNPWTLTIGGTIVGYLTNWMALKLIFEPIDPVYFCGFKLQGVVPPKTTRFRSLDYPAENVLMSEKIWNNVFTGRKRPEFDDKPKRTRNFVTKEGLERGLDSLGNDNGCSNYSICKWRTFERVDKTRGSIAWIHG